MSEYALRPLQREDERFLWEMLAQAAYRPTVRAVMDDPLIARYVAKWGRPGDMGLVATEPDGDRRVGAAWLRLWIGEDKGYGYVDDTTPELSVAVLPEHRGKGVGTLLITRLLEAARPAYPSVSLSVRSTNPALRLYERLGFVEVAGREGASRTGGGSLTLKTRSRPPDATRNERRV